MPSANFAWPPQPQCVDVPDVIEELPPPPGTKVEVKTRPESVNLRAGIGQKYVLLTAAPTERIKESVRQTAKRPSLRASALGQRPAGPDYGVRGSSGISRSCSRCSRQTRQKASVVATRRICWRKPSAGPTPSAM